MYLIIFAHPDNTGSHNAAILKHVKNRLEADFKKYEVIDLYADRFDPVLNIKVEAESKTRLVEKYKELVSKAETLIFIFPVWWYSTPAILKGFVDIIFSPGILDKFDTRSGIRNMLVGKKAIIINTFGRSKMENESVGSPLSLVFDKATLHFCGIERVKRIDWFDVRPPFLIPTDIINQINLVLK